MRLTVLYLITAAVLFAGAIASTPVSESTSIDSLTSVLTNTDSSVTQPSAIVYYFHRTARCHTCLTIEAYIDEALRSSFSNALEDGRLLWLPTDIEEPENFHFNDDFALEFNSAILVRMPGNGPTSWTNLERIWDLVDDKAEFLGYIRSHVTEALDVEAPAVGADSTGPVNRP